MTTTNRKRRRVRSDRNFIIYMITEKATQKFYIGKTFVRHTNDYFQSLMSRWQGHLRAAFVEARTHSFPTNIRQYSLENAYNAYRFEVMFVVRGEARAHELEALCINTLNAELNDKKSSRAIEDDDYDVAI